MMFKYSMKVKSKTVDSVQGMEKWIETLAENYGMQVKEFDLTFQFWKLDESIDCNILMYGPLFRFFKLWKDYHKVTTVKFGW